MIGIMNTNVIFQGKDLKKANLPSISEKKSEKRSATHREREMDDQTAGQTIIENPDIEDLDDFLLGIDKKPEIAIDKLDEDDELLPPKTQKSSRKNNAAEQYGY